MGITERKQRDRERRVNEILDAAMRVFLERDISGTTVDAIANAAEISKGTIYLYFKSKEEIAYALMLRDFRDVLAQLRERVSSAENALEGLITLARSYLDGARSEPQKFKLAYRIHRHFHNNIEEALKGMEENEYGRQLLSLTDEFAAFIGGIITRGMEDGSMRKDLDPKYTSMLVSGMLDGMLENLPLSSSPEFAAKMEAKWGVRAEALAEYSLNFIRHALQNPTEETH